MEKVKQSNLERLKNLKIKADAINKDYHLNMEKLNFYEKDIEYMIKKTSAYDQKLEKLIANYKYDYIYPETYLMRKRQMVQKRQTGRNKLN
jgi:hypothetical protein